ncbi:MAG: hypothetical protein HYV34_01570 [Candidatus Kerfeldbacteria bacterium]|nr:hypothetical protein [Candidatus Kerfeldbacteria bacterium]
MTHPSFFRNIRARAFLFILTLLLVPRSFSRAEDPPLELSNPLQVDNLLALVVQITGIALAGTALFALVMIIFGGLMIIASGGKEERVQKGKDTLLWAVIGLAIVLFSGVIMRFVIAGLDPDAIIGQS